MGSTRQAGSAASTNLLLVDKQASLSWTADADASVTGYEIYRTSGTGTSYYYLTTISGRTTVAYTDNVSDETIFENRVLEEHGDAPPTAYFCEPHKGRMWWLRTDANPTTGYFSDPGDPESVYTENNLNFSDSEIVGDQITGALGNFEGLLIVFTEKALWTVSGTGLIIGDIPDWTKTRTNAQTGCVSHRAAVRIPAGSKYTDQQGRNQTTTVSSVAYFTPLGDIRIFDGDNDLIVSHPVRDTIRAFNYAQRQKVWAMIDSENDQAIWFFPSSNAGECDEAVAWNYRFGVWYKWTDQNFGHGAELDTSSDAALMITGEARTATGGFLYQFFTGNSFAGSNIASQWMTKTLYGVNEEGQPALSHRKRWRWLDVLFRIDQNTTITVEWLTGDATNDASGISNVTITPASETLQTSSGSVIQTSSGSSIIVSTSSAQDKALLQDALNRYLHDEGIRLRIKTDGTAGGWALEALQLAYQILPGLKRRDQ